MGLVLLGPMHFVGADIFAPFGKRVYLTDSWGEVYKTKLRKTKEGVLWANVYAFTRTGLVVLNEDHTTSSVDCSYIKTWSYIKPTAPKKPTKADEEQAEILRILKSRG